MKQKYFVRKFILIIIFSVYKLNIFAQQTPYELKGKNYTATYDECIQYYKKIAKKYSCISMVEMGQTDSGLPLHLILFNKNGIFDPQKWRQQKNVVIFINNGIHPGEPDGIDASMMLVRDLAQSVYSFPDNVSLAFIPIYNIGGALERSEYNRVDQNGPEEFGSRGNAQYLDLNRDFIKCDSKNARSFAKIFHWLEPTIFIDNHVSDGADYPYIMTLATTQHNKLGGNMGKYLHETMEPLLFKQMQANGNPMIPYVNVWGTDAKLGWNQFFDAPRYSSGYASMFHTFSFTAETHMLKPYFQRVNATYTFMKCMIQYAKSHAIELIDLKLSSIQNSLNESIFPVYWELDNEKQTPLQYQGFEYKTKISDVSNLTIQYYDQNERYTQQIPFHNYYKPKVEIIAPEYYVIPQGWWKVIELLKLNQIEMHALSNDSLIEVESYHIESYNSSNQPYEGHHVNSDIKVKISHQKRKFRKGDMLIPLAQSKKRFIIETLEPQGHDSYFVWNFFDAILVQKEGYSAYAYEPLAATYLKENSTLQNDLKHLRIQDTSFAKNSWDQLDFIFTHSPYYEKGHNQYPIYRIMNNVKMITPQIDFNKKEYKNKKDE